MQRELEELTAHLRFAQQDIDRDDLGPTRREHPDQLAQQRPGPRPSAEGGEALLVDGRDDHAVTEPLGPPQLEVEIVEPDLDGVQELGRP